MLKYVLVFLLAPLAGYAQERCQEIRFARGASSALVQGMAPSDVPFACYTFATGAGQTAQIRLTRANPDTAFNVEGVVDNRDKYQFRTEARTYRIDVYQMSANRRPAAFTLEVSVR